MVNWAFAQGAAGAATEGGGTMVSFVLPMVFMVVIFYFLLIRPQQKKSKEHKALLDNLKKGDRITIYLPMIPEAAVAMLACSRIGAVHSVVFAGFSAHALPDGCGDPALADLF